ncbi:MAG: hypothetical protein CL916_12795 [Deltaproteobacteria bacterium]|nr:hypothetical protein [Deltaproteobacteria bacterium]
MSRKFTRHNFFNDACNNNTFTPERVSLRLDRSVEAVHVFIIDLPGTSKQIDRPGDPIQMKLDKRSVEQDGVVRYILPKSIGQKKNTLIRFDVQIQGEL